MKSMPTVGTSVKIRKSVRNAIKHYCPENMKFFKAVGFIRAQVNDYEVEIEFFQDGYHIGEKTILPFEVIKEIK